MDQIQMTPPAAIAATSVESAERVTAFLRRVYGWMCLGLAITATVALGVVSSPTLSQAIFSNKILFFGLFAAELGLVFYLSARINKMAAGTAAGLFLLYSALNGATLSLILLRYTGTSVASTFLVTAGMFGALALYGTATRRSLAGVGQFAFMGLIGIILASLVGMFWKSEGLQFGISIVGVIVFTDRLGRAEAEDHGSDGSRVQLRVVLGGRGARALPRLHQPVPVHAAVHGRAQRLTRGPSEARKTARHPERSEGSL